MYGLESFDNRINSIGDNIKKTEEEKQDALREFEETVKPDLVKEVEGRYLDKLNLMREELAKKKDEYMTSSNSREYIYHLIMKLILVKNLLMSSA